MKLVLVVPVMWFYRGILRVSPNEHVSNDKDLRKIRITRRLLLTIRNKPFKYLGHRMKKEGLQNLKLS